MSSLSRSRIKENNIVSAKQSYGLLLSRRRPQSDSLPTPPLPTQPSTANLNQTKPKPAAQWEFRSDTDISPTTLLSHLLWILSFCHLIAYHSLCLCLSHSLRRRCQCFVPRPCSPFSSDVAKLKYDHETSFVAIFLTLSSKETSSRGIEDKINHR